MLARRAERAERSRCRGARSGRTGSPTARTRTRSRSRSAPRSPTGVRVRATGPCSRAGSGCRRRRDAAGWRIRISSMAPMALNSVASYRRAASMKSLGRERGQEHEAAPGGDRTERRVRGRVDVEQRQRGHQPVVARELHPVREALARHHVGEMRLHDQLGAARGARGRDHHRDIDVRRRSPGRGRPARPRRARPRRRGGASPDEWRKVVVRDDQPRSGLLHEARELGGRALRVDRDLDGTDLHERQPGEQVLGACSAR